MPHRIHNERVKLRATLFNAAAISCFTVGVAAPLAAGVFYGASNISLRAILLGAIFWLAAAGTCRSLADRLRSRLHAGNPNPLR